MQRYRLVASLATWYMIAKETTVTTLVTATTFSFSSSSIPYSFVPTSLIQKISPLSSRTSLRTTKTTASTYKRALHQPDEAPSPQSQPSQPSSPPKDVNSHDNTTNKVVITRRQMASSTLAVATTMAIHPHDTALASATTEPPTRVLDGGGKLYQVTDPETYSALVYTPPSLASPTNDSDNPKKKLPVLLVLHGAGKNELDIWNLANMNGEHAGLPSSLLTTSSAPSQLRNDFVVVTPYSQGVQSFYSEPRGKLIRFIRWLGSVEGERAGCPSSLQVDYSKMSVLGFSDGATLGVELLTVPKLFVGAVICSYGFTGVLPQLALERLKGLPIWVFHCVEDGIFPVACSDRLVRSLRMINGDNDDIRGDDDVVRYSRFETDPEGFRGKVRGHTTGITASKMPQVYDWLLSIM